VFTCTEGEGYAVNRLRLNATQPVREKAPNIASIYLTRFTQVCSWTNWPS